MGRNLRYVVAMWFFTAVFTYTAFFPAAGTTIPYRLAMAWLSGYVLGLSVYVLFRGQSEHRPA